MKFSPSWYISKIISCFSYENISGQKVLCVKLDVIEWLWCDSVEFVDEITRCPRQHHQLNVCQPLNVAKPTARCQPFDANRWLRSTKTFRKQHLTYCYVLGSVVNWVVRSAVATIKFKYPESCIRCSFTRCLSNEWQRIELQFSSLNVGWCTMKVSVQPRYQHCHQYCMTLFSYCITNGP